MWQDYTECDLYILVTVFSLKTGSKKDYYPHRRYTLHGFRPRDLFRSY